MKRFSEQLNKKAKSIHLKASEKRELQARLVSYMEYHPLPAEVAKTAPKAEMIESEKFTTVGINFLYVRNFMGIFMMFLVIGLPIVANRAVPGDVLYPVKVQFNEEVRSTLTLSPYKKVEWETERLERRITEARLLASEGKLTPEVEAEVAEAVKEHSEAAQKEIATIREDDSEEADIAEITLASALAVQSDVLEGHVENDTLAEESPEGRSVEVLAGAVGVALATAEASTGDAPLSTEKLRARIETETTRAYEYFNSIDAIVSEEERQDIERRLLDISTKLGNSSNEEGVAISTELLTEVLTDTQKLISFMTNIDVRENVTVEELVPITLTDEERIAQIQERTDAAGAIQAEVESRLDTVSDDLIEKVTVGMEALVTALDTASTSLKVSDFDSADTASIEALTIAEDLMMITESVQVIEEVLEVPEEEEAVEETPEEIVVEEPVTETEEEPEPVVEEQVTEEVVEETPEEIVVESEEI